METGKKDEGQACIVLLTLWISGLQEQHVPYATKHNFEGCESVNEAEGKEIEECNSYDGEVNGRSPVMEQLSMTQVEGIIDGFSK